MIDENAFGLWVSYYEVEEDEYALERDEFVERFERFKRSCNAFIAAHSLGSGVSVFHLGHALYVEIADGDHETDPIVWLKNLRERLAEEEFATAAVLTHGSRWVSEAPSLNGVRSLPGPSEPLRRAQYADSASRYDEEDAPDGWGPGLYIDEEAVEALGKNLKNAPTALLAGGAVFYRAGR